MATTTERTPLHRRFSPFSPPETPGASGRSRRLWAWLGGTLLLLFSLAFFTPTIIAHSPLFGWVLHMATAPLRGDVRVGSASLGWFSPIRLSEIEVIDEQDQVVLEIPEFQGRRWLTGMLWDSSRPGHFRVEKPKLNLVLRQDGSNLEDVLTEYLQAEQESAPVETTIEVVDGTAEIQDIPGRTTWHIENLQATVSTSAETDGPIRVVASGSIVDGRSPGTFEMDLVLGGKATSPDAETSPQEAGQEVATESRGNQLKLQTQAVPLALLNGWCARADSRLNLQGQLNCRLDCAWDGPESQKPLEIRGDAAVAGFRLAASALGEDVLALDQLKARAQVSSQKRHTTVESLDLQSELGRMSLTGAVEVNQLASGGVWQALLQQSYDFQGQVDLGKLAEKLPDTLHIHEQTRVTSGQLRVAINSKRTAQGMRWDARLETSDLTAVRRGDQLVWEQPIQVALAAHESPQGTVVETLRCDSTFLKIYAAGTPQDMSGSLSFDLKRLVHRLDGFVDLREVKLSGNGWANFNWRRDLQGKFQTDAELQIRELEVGLPGRPAWQEENVLSFLVASGRTDFGLDTRLDEGELEIRSGNELIVARLLEPTPSLRQGGVWSMELDAEGELNRWFARLRPWLAPYANDLAGSYKLRAVGNGSAKGVELRESQARVKQLRYRSTELNIEEPVAEVTLNGRWDRSTSQVLLKLGTIATTAISARADDLIVAMPEGSPMKLVGNVAYNGDLRRLHRWFTNPDALPTWHVAGRLQGHGRLQREGEVTNATLDSTINDLQVVDAANKQFHEETVRLSLRGAYQHRVGILNLDKLELTSDTLRARQAGQVDTRGGTAELKLDGQASYDLEKVCAMLRPYFGQGVQVFGRDTSTVRVRGPLDLTALQAETSLRWAGADLYGFLVGPGQLQMQLADGVLRTEPLDVTVSEGRLTLSPRMHLAPGPAVFELESGPLAQQVHITPRMCAGALQYIAPILAGVATAQGKFSLEMDGCRIPIADPAQGELAGRFIVHSVAVGPGPLVQELALVLGRASPATLAKESVVQFRMVDGRVYHQGLELVFPDITIRTHGSVGLDQSLAMVAEMPVPAKWMGTHPLGSALRDQTIRLPIAGTLKQPKIDRRVLDQYSQQFLRRATQNLIEDHLGEQLQRLFPPPK